MTATVTLYETIQRIVQSELQRLHTAEVATVQESHPHSDESDTDNFACTVVLRNTGLVLKQVPVAVPRIGQVSIPVPGDLVLVQFIGGDLNAPVITGSFYNDTLRPPVNKEQQGIWQLPTGAGEDPVVCIVMTGDSPQHIHMQVGSACKLTLIDDDPVVTLEVDGGAATLQIDRDGAVTINSQGSITMEGSEISHKAQSALNLECDGNTIIKGATVNIN